MFLGNLARKGPAFEFCLGSLRVRLHTPGGALGASFIDFFFTHVLELSCKNVDLEPTEGPGVGVLDPSSSICSRGERGSERVRLAAM